MFCAPGSFPAVPRASGPVFKFCAPGLVFDGTTGIESHFQVLRSRTRFWRYRGRRVPLSCFARPDTFLAVSRASGPVFIFCAPGLTFDGSEGDGFRFQVFDSRPHFLRYRGRRVPFASFSRHDSFSAVPRASALVFDSTEGIGSRFYVLRYRTHFRL
jgi:hypothetical protein